jgi:hypothetical protein
MKLIFTVFTLSLFPFLSCKKDARSTKEITGLVLHKFTRQPVAGCEVILEYSVINRTVISPEYPDGLPQARMLKTITNGEGRYAFGIVADRNAWLMPYLAQGGYQGTATFLISQSVPISDSIWGMATIDKSRFDTIWAEKAGYVRFIIENTGQQFFNDTLIIKKSYSARHVTDLDLPWPGKMKSLRSSYVSDRMGFSGATVKSIVVDTIEAESITQREIEWIYKRSDTIMKKQEIIHVSAGAVTDVTIQY